MNNKEYIERLFDSDKPLIIYRVNGGFNVYTDFSKKIKINRKNAKSFFEKTVNQKNIKNSVLHNDKQYSSTIVMRLGNNFDE